MNWQEISWVQFAEVVREARCQFDIESIAEGAVRNTWADFLSELDKNIDAVPNDWPQLLIPAFRKLKKSMCVVLPGQEATRWLNIWSYFSKKTNATSLTMLEALNRNDPEAWRSFIIEYEGFLSSRAAQLTKKYPSVDPEEVIVDLYGKLFESVKDFQRENWGHFRAWLSKFLWHLFQSAVRRQLKEKGTDAADLLSDPNGEPSQIFEAELLAFDLAICEGNVKQTGIHPANWSWYESARDTDTPWHEIGQPTKDKPETVRKSASRTLAKVKLELARRGHDVRGIRFRRRRRD